MMHPSDTIKLHASDGSKTEVAALERHVRCTLQERTSSDRPGMSQRCQEQKSLHFNNLISGEPQNCPVTARRIASGSTGCSTRSITPFWQTAAGALGVPAAGRHIANSESDFTREA